MTDLLLRERDQAALRAVLASEPVPGVALAVDSALHHLSRLIPSDAIGIALLDGTGTVVGEVDPRQDRTTEDHPDTRGGLVLLGVQHRRRVRTHDGSGRRGVEVLALGVRSGPRHVVQLWMVRRMSVFSARDLALFGLLAPSLERLLRERPRTALPPSVTVQERRVLQHVAAGLSNGEIAERLFVAPSTVRKHLENAYRKLGVTNRLAAVYALERRRSTEPDPRDEPGVDRVDAYV